jgi:hypothetical protein
MKRSRSFWLFGTKKFSEVLIVPLVSFCTSSSENGITGSSCKIVSDQAQYASVADAVCTNEARIAFVGG